MIGQIRIASSSHLGLSSGAMVWSMESIALIFPSDLCILRMAMKRDDWLQIQKELSILYELHEAAISQTGKCRDFNSRTSILLQHLEELEAFDLADRVMDLLAGCNPKDTSPCDNRLSTKASLERLQEKIKNKILELEKD